MSINNKYGKKILEIINIYKNRNPNQILAEDRLIISQLALDAYREMNLMVLNSTSIKVVYLPISEARTVDMPDDYVSYSKVGVPFGNEIWTLSTNEDLLPPLKTRDECGLTVEEALENGDQLSFFQGGYYFSSHYDKNGEFVGKLYGIGGGFNSKGYFKEDFANRRFILSRFNLNLQEIVLEYKSNELGFDTIVPQYAVEGVIAFVRWHLSMAEPETALSKTSYYEGLYTAQLQKMIEYQNPFRIDEYLDAYYRDVHMTIKR